MKDLDKKELIEELKNDREFREKVKRVFSQEFEPDKNDSSKEIPRRKFLGGALAGAAVLDFASGGSRNRFNQKWDGLSIDRSGKIEAKQIGSPSRPVPKMFTNNIGSDASRTENIHAETANLGNLSFGDITAGSFTKIVNNSAAMGNVAVVAPSYEDAYDTASDALNDGNKNILIAEEFKDSNIPLMEDDITIRGFGLASRIIQEENGEPLFTTGDNEVSRITIKDLSIRGETIPQSGDYGPAISAWPTEGYGAVDWSLENISGRCGPIVMKGSGIVMHHVRINSESNLEFPEKSPPGGYRTRAAIILAGANNQLWGGTFSAKTDAREAALLSSHCLEIGGGGTYTNAGDVPDGNQGSDGRTEITFHDVKNLTMGAVSFESGKEYQMKFGLDTDDPEMENLKGVESATLVGTQAGKVAFEGSDSGQITWLNPNGNIRIDQHQRVSNFDIYTNNSAVTVDNSTVDVPAGEDINVIGSSGGAFSIGQKGSDRPTTPLMIPPRAKAPDHPRSGQILLADGANWDPTGTGNAAMVRYDGDSWKTITDLGQPIEPS